MPSLFISYRRGDSPDTVKLIHERLKRRLPRWEIFYDHDSIPLGEQFPERLRAKVASATVVLVVIGPQWLRILRERKAAAVDHVRVEVRLALEAGANVIPVLVGGAALPADADFADFPDLRPLLARNGCPVRPDPDFDADLEPLIARLRQFESDEAVGATIAEKYTLTAEVGHGGMGVVYRAEQKQPVRRTVAVKLIKPGMDSREVLARFDAERQALAVMDHPNIAKVYDAGLTAAGRPFFVMEYVKGLPITQYCDDKKLTPGERLNLFIPVCHAVQHAHQKGILHRDLKPSNVLVEEVDGAPVAKVIDFGLAKALGPKLTEQTLCTALDMRVGTLEYSSPEQAAGRSFDVDTRSDIYSLGILLYELLTGAPPFTHEELLTIGEEEMRRVIREQEPTRPSKKLSSSGELPTIAAKRHLEPKRLTRLVQGDLDWIVMRCLEKERDRRYKNANDVAEELQRFLADEPVQAGPPSAAYRLRKFVQRHRAGLLTAAAALLAVLSAAGVAGWALWDRAAQRAERRLEEARRGAETERVVSVALARAQQLAEQAGQMPANSSAEAAAALVVWRQAEDALAPASAVLGAGVARDDLRERVAGLRARLGEARRQAEQARAGALRKEKLLRDLDGARMATATTKESRFDYAGAAERYAAAFAAYGLEVPQGQPALLARQISGQEPAIRDALIVALDHWAWCASEPERAHLLAIARSADPDEWRGEYRRAVAARDVPALRRLAEEARRLTLPVVSLQLLARALQRNDQPKEAVELLRWARGRHPTDFWIAMDLGDYLSDPSAVGVDLEERIGCFRVAVALRPDASAAHYNIGVALRAKGQVEEAIAAYRTAIALDPKNATAHTNLGGVLADKGQLEEAIAAFRQAIALDPNHAKAHTNLGGVLADKGQLEEAIAAFRTAIALNPKAATAHSNLGLALAHKGQLEEAVAAYRTAIALNPKAATAHRQLGLVFVQLSRFVEAEASFQRSVELHPATDPGRKATEEWLRRARRFIELEKKLPMILAGKIKVTDAAGCADVFELCLLKHLNATAARFAERAFADQPALADDLDKSCRYSAACCAALAAAGQGKDADGPTDAERLTLRRQALQWLHADLSAWSKRLDKDADTARPAVQKTMAHWKDDSDLAGVRDAKALEKLPPDERAAWQKLWQEVDALRAKASQGK